MKRIVVTIFTIIISVNSFSQTSENLTSELTSISNELGINSNSSTISNSYSRKLNPTELSFIESKKALFLNFELDLRNAIAFVIVNSNGVTITSVSIPYVGNDKVLNYIYEGTDYLIQNLTASYNNENGKLFLKLENTVETNTAGRWASWSAWTGCMTNFFNSNVGTFVNILGVAGGVGCVACGAVAGAVTGVMMIACTQAH